MFNYAQVKNQKIIGLQSSSKKINHVDLIPINDEIIALGDNYIDVVFSGKSLIEVKTEKITQIKAEANRRISALDWQIDRANRKTALKKKQKRAKNDVYQLQDDIELASDNAEIAVNKLKTIKEVEDFVW